MKYKILSLRKGLPIATIRGGKYNNHVIHIDESENQQNQDFFLDDKDGVVQPIYHKQLKGDAENRYTINGCSGAGKSTFAKRLSDQYLENNPKNKVVIFSGIPKSKDKVFTCEKCRKKLKSYEDKGGEISDSVKEKMQKCKECGKYMRIKLDQDLIDNPMDVSELANSLVIFDDIDRLPEPEMVKMLMNLRDRIFKSGRQDDTAVLNITQNVLQGHKSAVTNQNALNIVCFPGTGTRYQLISFLEKYMQIPKAIVNDISKLPSRWISINLCEPQYILHEKGSFIL